MQNKLKDKFNTKKLELYLKLSERGFILLSVNDSSLQQQLIQLVSEFRSSMIFNIEEMDFRDTLQVLKNSRVSGQAIVYHGFQMEYEQLKLILEKINLSRDLLLEQNRLFVFIVPQYVALEIQDKFPNLYSYFILKERYVETYPLVFEYILPGKGYLNTKETQHEAKKYYLSMRNSIEERLEYFSHTRVSKRDVLQLKEDVQERICQITKYDNRYEYILYAKLGRVLAIQGQYQDALEIYKRSIFKTSMKSDYLSLYYEVLLDMSDVFFMSGEFEEAKGFYEYALSTFLSENREDLKSIYNEFLVKVFTRIALCYVRKREFEPAFKYINAAVQHIQNNSDLKEKDHFDIYYNYLLMILNRPSSEEYIIEKVFDFLRVSVCNRVQEAIYLTIFAWYEGIVLGKVKKELPYALHALNMKRELCIENDIRIAESHYVISIMYVLLGDFEKAKYCWKKYNGILKNFDKKELKEEMTKLWDEIEPYIPIQEK